MNKKQPLKLNKEFKRLYFKGKSAVHPLIVTYASKNRLGRKPDWNHSYQKSWKSRLQESL